MRRATLRLFGCCAMALVAAVGFFGFPGHPPGAPSPSVAAAQSSVLPQSVADLAGELRAAGATVEMAGGVVVPVISAPGRTLRVDGAPVTVFDYANAPAAAAEAVTIAPDGRAVGDTVLRWTGSPHFFLEGRLLVLYVGDDDRLLRLLTMVLGEQIAGG
jgi:hypothetical protein